MKVMVFGGTGYLAGFVLDQLVADGHDVVAVRRSEADSVGRNATVNAATCRSAVEARKLIGDLVPDVVVNMANYFSKVSTPEDIARFSAVNCELIAELSQGCVDSSSDLLHVGSAWQATFEENDPSLGSPYALFKGLAAQIIEWYKTWHDLRAYTLNLFDTYGPGDTRGKVVQFLTDNIGSSEPLELSEGHQILELVHVSDVATAVSGSLQVIAKSRATGQRPDVDEFWAYPTEANTLRQIVQTLDDLSGTPLTVNWGARQYRVGEQFERVIEGRALVPGWTQRMSLRDGLNTVLSSSGSRT